MPPITAFILVGGKSSRMASDKAFLEFAGRSLLARSLDLARSLTLDVRIVGDPEKFAAFAPVVPDLYPARGPLGGIHAALAISSTDFSLILAVDLPFLNPPFLRYLIAEAESANTTVTVPHAAGHFHPLTAIYRKPFGIAAERALAEGRNKVDSLFSEVSTRIIAEDELTAAGFAPSIFRNLNTPEDWQQAKQQFVERP